MLNPHYIDLQSVFEKQFLGMTKESFTYEDYEETRKQLLKMIHQTLTLKDRDFLLSIEMGKPNWSVYDFNFFPAVQWKLMNVARLIAENPKKHQGQIEHLKSVLF